MLALAYAKKFLRGANAIFSKIVRLASEEVVLQLVKSKCIPILLYSLEPFDLSTTDLRSMDFVINRFFMKLFMNVIQLCQSYFCFDCTASCWKIELKNIETSTVNIITLATIHGWSTVLHISVTFFSLFLLLDCFYFIFLLLFASLRWIKLYIGLLW